MGFCWGEIQLSDFMPARSYSVILVIPKQPIIIVFLNSLWDLALSWIELPLSITNDIIFNIVFIFAMRCLVFSLSLLP